MSTEPRRLAYKAMGTQWNITLWDAVSDDAWNDIGADIQKRSGEFEETYSRFRQSSLIWSLSRKLGVTEVPDDLVKMLRLYETLHDLSGGKCNPLIGFSLSDLGYDAEYSLREKQEIRQTPDFHSAIRIIDETHIELLQNVLIDLGALGKGYFVDLLAGFLTGKGYEHFLVDGSGDIFYKGNGHPIRAGLEHPGDTSKVIGVVEMTDGAMCSSAGNRRKWGKHTHIVDPQSLTSPEKILATWVTAESCALADGIATCLFFVDPDQMKRAGTFEYCILNDEYKVKRSEGFVAELFK